MKEHSNIKEYWFSKAFTYFTLMYLLPIYVIYVDCICAKKSIFFSSIYKNTYHICFVEHWTIRRSGTMDFEKYFVKLNISFKNIGTSNSRRKNNLLNDFTKKGTDTKTI